MATISREEACGADKESHTHTNPAASRAFSRRVGNKKERKWKEGLSLVRKRRNFVLGLLLKGLIT